MADNFDLKSIFSCNYCNCILKSPVILPCSESICQMHVEQMKIKSKDSCSQALNCFFCKREHSIPNDGFPKDMRTSKLIENRFHQMDLGNEHKKAIDSCKEMEKMIDKLENLTKDPQNFILEYFQKIINGVDLFREVYKLQIENWHEKCLKEIQTYKDECVSRLKKDLKVENSIIHDFKWYLEFWQKKIKVPELSNKTYSFQSINSKAQSACLNLGASIDALKTEFLLGKEYELESRRKFSINDFPYLKSEKRVILSQINDSVTISIFYIEINL